MTLPSVRGFPGWRGSTWLVDREKGLIRTLAYWDGKDALDSSTEAATRIRGDFVREAPNATVVAVETFEVALQAGKE